MNLKAIFALFLGLIIQFGLVVPASSAVLFSCQDEEEVSSCDVQSESCCCVSNDETPKAPSFPVPAPSSVLKVPLASVNGLIAIESEDLLIVADVISSAVSQRGPPVGYAGVALNVAFCTFVI